MRMRNLLFVLFIAVSFILVSCESQNPVESKIETHEFSSVPSVITVPYGVTVTSAVLKLDSYQATHTSVKYADYSVYTITQPWNESTVSWDNFMPQGQGNKVSGFTVALGVNSITIPATLVQKWIDGTAPNNGLFIRQNESLWTLGTNYSKFNSSEGSPLQPTLVVTFSDGSTSSSVAVQDAYIHERDHWATFNTTELAIGFIKMAPSTGGDLQNWDKPAMVQFNFEVLPPEDSGCSLTPGYWKTHVDGKKRDATWELLTDLVNPTLSPTQSTLFFYSDMSYINLLKSATKGNPYIILAHAYIAAKLNKLNGAEFTEAQDAFDAATALFNNPANVPAEIKKLKGDAKAVWINLATTLDMYNNGDIGPGHCD